MQYSCINAINVIHSGRQEMIEIVRESVIHMLHTRDGARVAMHCLWYGTAKVNPVTQHYKDICGGGGGGSVGPEEKEDKENFWGA